MTDLPDLETGSLGAVAYWNALDHGATSVDPADVLEYDPIDSFTSADNGLDATIDETRANAADISVSLRVKTDGWFVAWLSPAETFASDGTAHGLLDVVDEWADPTYGSTALDLEANRLAAHIEGAVAELSNAADVEFALADVGLYSYAHPDATVAELHREAGAALGGRMAVHSTIDREYHAVGGADANGSTSFAGATVSTDGAGLVDALDGLATQTGTLYDHGGSGDDAHLTHLLLYTEITE